MSEFKSCFEINTSDPDAEKEAMRREAVNMHAARSIKNLNTSSGGQIIEGITTGTLESVNDIDNNSSNTEEIISGDIPEEDIDQQSASVHPPMQYHLSRDWHKMKSSAVDIF